MLSLVLYVLYERVSMREKERINKEWWNAAPLPKVVKLYYMCKD